MSDQLSLSRAARVVGVARGVLQRMVRDGSLNSFDGNLSAEELLRHFPDAKLEDTAELDRVTQIKDRAFGKRIFERALPDKEVLAARLHVIGTELAQTRSRLESLDRLIDQMAQKLVELESDFGGPAEALASLREWLRHERDNTQDAEQKQAVQAREHLLRVMSPQVRIMPSEREFFVEGNDTLLEAALRAGVPLDYGCSNGNCGDCKARVLAGEVKQVRHHDYVFSEAEKAAGYVLMCSTSPVTDVVIEAGIAASAQDIPVQQVEARVKAVEKIGDDHAILHLQTPRSRRLRFLAGQSAILRHGDTTIELPIASCPCDDRNLLFHLRHWPDNAFAQRVFDELRFGDTLQIDGPRGDFVFRENSHRPLVFVAIETGFAPIKSIIEHVMALEIAEPLHLYWLVREEKDLYLANLCRAWVDAMDNMHFIPMIAPPGADFPEFIAGAVERIGNKCGPLSERDVYLAGNATFTQSARQKLLAQGAATSQLYCGVSAW